MKMSKSKPRSAVFVHDSPDEIRAKLRGAFCPPGEVELNPVIDWIEHLCFGLATTEAASTSGNRRTWAGTFASIQEVASLRLRRAPPDGRQGRPGGPADRPPRACPEALLRPPSGRRRSPRWSADHGLIRGALSGAQGGSEGGELVAGPIANTVVGTERLVSPGPTRSAPSPSAAPAAPPGAAQLGRGAPFPQGPHTSSSPIELSAPHQQIEGVDHRRCMASPHPRPLSVYGLTTRRRRARSFPRSRDERSGPRCRGRDGACAAVSTM